MSHPIRLLFIATSLGALALSGCNREGAPAPAKTAAPSGDPIASAEAAAPAAVSGKATIVTAGADGAMTVLRKGSNAFTCMPDNPVTPGPDPMCMDANATRWAMAWIRHEAPPAETSGFMYMLAGGTDASNTDPYATKPTAGPTARTGPHVMLVGSQRALAGYPAGPVPDTSQPYVMWSGTPYAHLMVPVS